MTTVNEPAAEREPDHVTPEPYMTAAEAAELRALFTGNPVINHAECQLRNFGVEDGEVADAVKLLLAWPDFNLLAEREVRGVAARFVPVQAEPERRTVSLEVLTDELRTLAALEYTGGAASLLPLAKVAIVGRINSRADAVTDIDSDWHANGASALTCLMKQAQTRADSADAELLMPGADVLAALDGRPDAGFWSAPVPVTARHIEEGWLVVGYSGPGMEERVEAKNTECGAADCPWPGDCTQLTIGDDKPQHFADWTTLTVRLPATVTRCGAA